ncbi:MAG TPA: hypothetical protein VFV50_01935 [Bdellovibrionales bacterium]|nr:hypothetical protein [Bdellovibrionales bacterium]
MKHFIYAAAALAVMNACAPKPDQAACTPNFVGSGMSIRMEYLRENSDGSGAYSIKLCEDANPNSIVFSVYGVSALETAVTNPVTAVRLQSALESSHSGAQFEVNFRNGDHKFFIFQDRPLGANSYALDTTRQLVSGELSQATYAGGSGSGN